MMQARKDVLLPSQKDFVIYDVRWILDADPDVAGAIGRTSAYNEALIRFLCDNGLLSCPEKWQGFEDWSRFVLSVGDLTEEGFALVKRCHDKWLCGIDRHEKNVGDMRVWQRELGKMRGTGNDYALTRAEWFIKYMASFEWSREQSVAWLEAVYSPLLEFMREHHLLSNRDFKVENWSEFVLMSSDLTEEGGALYGRCEQKWLKSVGRGKKNPGDMTLWQRELQSLRGVRQ